MNLKQREYRRRKKKNFPVSGSDAVRTERSGALAGDAPKSGVTFETKKVGELRMLVMPAATCQEEPQKPVVLQDKFGRVLTPRQWEILQERKRRAKEGGYTIDDYS